MREKPRATTLAVESFIMLGNNKTVVWLAAKTAEERGAILQAARSLVPRHRELARERKKNIQEFKARELERHRQQRDQKRLQELQQITAALATAGGLWTTVEQVKTSLAAILGAGRKREALKCQLRFRKKVLRQEGSAALFAFSKDGKPLSLDALRRNLEQLIAAIPDGQRVESETDEDSGEDDPDIRRSRSPPKGSSPEPQPVRTSSGPADPVTNGQPAVSHQRPEQIQHPPPRPAGSGWLLPAALCQSRWRRDPEGSNACTIIAIVLGSKLNANMPELPLPQLLNGFVSTLTTAIEDGNTLHDSQTGRYGQAVNYSVEEAIIALQGSIRVQVVDADLPASFAPLVPEEMTLHCQLEQLCQQSGPRFAVYVSNTEKSYLLHTANGSVLLVDTHQHGEQFGAVVASGSVDWIVHVFLEHGMAAYGTISVISFQ